MLIPLLFRQVILKAYPEKPGLPSPRTLFNSQHLPADEGPWILHSLASLRLPRVLSLPLTFSFSPCLSYTPPSESSLPLRTQLEACRLAVTHWVPGLRCTHCSFERRQKVFFDSQPLCSQNLTCSVQIWAPSVTKNVTLHKWPNSAHVLISKMGIKVTPILQVLSRWNERVHEALLMYLITGPII